MNLDLAIVEIKLTGGITKDFVDAYLHLFFILSPTVRTKTTMQLRAFHDRNWAYLEKWDDSWFDDEAMAKLGKSDFALIHNSVYGFVRDHWKEYK